MSRSNRKNPNWTNRPASPAAKGARKKPARQKASQKRDLVALRQKIVHLERQLFERDLERERYVKLYNFAPVGYISFDPEGRITDINITAAIMLGQTRAKMIGSSFSMYVERNHLDRFVDHLRRSHDSALSVTTELNLCRRDSTFFNVQIVTSRVPCAESEGAIFQSALTDLTDRREMERELREHDVRLRLAAKTAGFGTYRFDLLTGQYSWSPEMKEIAGVTFAESSLSMERMKGIVHPEDWDRMKQKLDASMDPNGSGKFEDEHRLVRPDGSIRWVLLKGRTDFEFDGFRKVARSATGIVQDITERKWAEAELLRAMQVSREANRAKDDFIAALSHELRTPLNPVLLLASVLEESPDLPEQFREDISTIRRNVELEARLIDDLLDLTRITRGKLHLKLEPVEIHEILQNAIDILKADLEQKKLSLFVSFGAYRPVVRGDSVRLQQVFWNVIKNAVKFTPVGGRITVSTRCEENRVIVQVCDTGVGIEPGELERIFDSFNQAHSGHRFGGLGLGLAISRSILQMHGATIEASSPGRDQGACFSVQLEALPQHALKEFCPSGD